MKKLLCLIFISTILFQLSLNAQDRNFGLGIILGEPTGVSAKLWTSGDNAFDFAAAWSFKGDGHLLQKKPFQLEGKNFWNILIRMVLTYLSRYYMPIWIDVCWIL